MHDERILGIEGGGTKTAWALVVDDVVLESGKMPPSNLRLTPPAQIRQLFWALPRQIERVGVFLAGCATEEDRTTLRAIAHEVWPHASLIVGSDRESGLAACLRDRDGVVVNAGTGSSVTGRRGDQTEMAGGWGHILGDTGGAYFVSIRALRVILRDYDLRQVNRRFAARILEALKLADFDGLVSWAQTADKTEIASLAPVVFDAAKEGDETVERILQASTTALADFAGAVAQRLGLDSPEVRLMGGLFEHQESYRRLFAAALRTQMDNCAIMLTDTPPEIGAVWLAKTKAMPPERIDSYSALTEQANPRFARLDELSTREFVELFLSEEQSVEVALRSQTRELARAIELASEAIASGGRIFYIGAGTSGRLGALDAAEIPPTFGADPDLFQAIIAGGSEALQRSIEGAEDDEHAGALAIESHKIGEHDVAIGISASGHAAFVIGALRQARESGSRTIFLTCNPIGTAGLDLAIVLPTGPEIIAGSTRLKAGTATKIALNIISTGAMVRLGHVEGNLMIDLQPTNRKLRERAVRLVSQLRACDRETARSRLEKTGWNVRAALQQTNTFDHKP